MKRGDGARQQLGAQWASLGTERKVQMATTIACAGQARRNRETVSRRTKLSILVTFDPCNCNTDLMVQQYDRAH